MTIRRFPWAVLVLFASIASAASAETWTTGPKTFLYMRVDYPDRPGTSVSVGAAQNAINNSSEYYNRNTYGRLPSIAGTVTTVLRMPRNYTSYPAGFAGRVLIRQDAEAAAKAAGWDPANYDLQAIALVPTQIWVPPFTGNGKGTNTGKGIVFRGIATRWQHLSHELGHNFGNRHADLWDTSGSNPIGPGTALAYGDRFDNMGNGGADGIGDNNPWLKNRQGWLDDADIKTVTASGTYRIQTLGVADQGNNWVALRIRRDQTKNYWVFYRSEFAESENGALISWGFNNRSNVQLLDMTPGSSTGKNDSWDAALLVGETFNDSPANIQITVLSKNATTPPTLDIEVTLGTPNNAAPAVDAGPDRLIVWPTNSVNLNGSVIDPGGSPTIEWTSFAEGAPPVSFSSPNSANTTATFSSPGSYTLRLSANDGVNDIPSPMIDAVRVMVVSSGSQGLILVNPEEEDLWTMGDPATVSWGSAGISNVKIELSRIGGDVENVPGAWETLVASTPAASGSWTWNSVTGPASARCIIRISDAADGSPVSSGSKYQFFHITSGQSVQVPSLGWWGRALLVLVLVSASVACFLVSPGERSSRSA